MRDRRDVARERIWPCRRCGRDDEASFHGEHVQLEPSWSWPKPVQVRAETAGATCPCCSAARAGPKLFAHIAEYGDGWIPIGGAGLAEAIPRLRAAVEDAGRDPATLEIVPFGSIPDAGKLDHFE